MNVHYATSKPHTVPTSRLLFRICFQPPFGLRLVLPFWPSASCKKLVSDQPQGFFFIIYFWPRQVLGKTHSGGLSGILNLAIVRNRLALWRRQRAQLCCR